MAALKCSRSKRFGSILLVGALLLSISTATLYSAAPAKALGQLSANTFSFNGPKDDRVYSIIKTNDGGFALAGYTESYGAGGSDMWLIKTVQRLWGTSCYYQAYAWNETYGGMGDDTAKCVIQTRNGGFALAGFTNSSGAGGFDMWLVKTDDNGNEQWNMTYVTYKMTPLTV